MNLLGWSDQSQARLHLYMGHFATLKHDDDFCCCLSWRFSYMKKVLSLFIGGRL
jgi:hypothetical protein